MSWLATRYAPRSRGLDPLVRVRASVKGDVINGDGAFFGFYLVVTHDVRVSGENISIFDPMGKDAVLFHYTDDGDPESIESIFVVQVREWFDSVWSSVTTEVTP